VPPINTPETVQNPKRAVILRHAIETFAQEGFRHADVQRIADRAGVGKGTVYRNFSSKEELFDAATFDVLVRLERCMFSAIEGIDDELEALRELGRAHSRFFERNPSYLEIFVQNRAEFRGTVPERHKQLHERMIERSVRIVESGMAKGRIVPAEPRGVVMSLGVVLYGTIMFGCYVKDDYDLLELGETALNSYLQGIGVSDLADREGDQR
jgi:AcrR family transcriptional regulator